MSLDGVRLVNGTGSNALSSGSGSRSGGSRSGSSTPNGTAPPRQVLVQKYGGTSVGKFPDKIADIVKRDVAKGRVAVVCSARSTATKLEGTTNRLLRAAHEAENLESRAYEDISAVIRKDHLDAAQTYIRSDVIRQILSAHIDEECKDLVNFLEAAQRVREISTRSLDTVISKGEILSCHFMAAVLEDAGVPAQFVDLSDIVPTRTDTMHVKAPEGVGQEFYDSIASAIAVRLESCWPKVPVITGYFGIVPGGLMNQVGRGYTDLCAALVAVGMSASELQIWKEVDGIFSADPRKVPTARLLPSITPAEASELTFYGSEVIHPFTMDQVIRKKIPIGIRNVMNPQGPGTKVVPDTSEDGVDIAFKGRPRLGNLSFRTLSSLTRFPGIRPKRPTAVTIKRNILVMNVHSNKRSLSHGFFARIFGVLDKWRLSVDLISTSEVHVSMALHSENAFVRSGLEGKRIVDDDLKGALEELKQVGDVDLIDEMAILSLVGREMKNMVGIAGRMFSVLGESNVNIEMISQGASEINISCVIEGRDADRAMSILHTNLFTFLDDDPH